VYESSSRTEEKKEEGVDETLHLHQGDTEINYFLTILFVAL